MAHFLCYPRLRAFAGVEKMEAQKVSRRGGSKASLPSLRCFSKGSRWLKNYVYDECRHFKEEIVAAMRVHGRCYGQEPRVSWTWQAVEFLPKAKGGSFSGACSRVPSSTVQKDALVPVRSISKSIN